MDAKCPRSVDTDGLRSDGDRNGNGGRGISTEIGISETVVARLTEL